MRNFKYSLAAKITASILFMFSLIAAFGALAGIEYMAENGFYSERDTAFYNSQICLNIMRNKADDIYRGYFALSQKLDQTSETFYELGQYKTQYSNENTNYFFTVTDSNGNVLLSNFVDQDYGTHKSYYYYEEKSEKSFFVNGYVKNPITARDEFYIQNTLYSMRYILIVIVAVAVLFGILMFIFLICSAGHRKGKEEIVLNGLDKIPFDMYAACLFLLALFTAYLCTEHNPSGVWRIAFLCVGAIIVALLVLAFWMSFAARLKAGKWYKNTDVYWILKQIYRLLRAMAKPIRNIFANLPLLWKTILIFAGYLLINGILVIIFVYAPLIPFLLGLLFNFAALAGLCYLTLQMRQIKLGGEKIASGDFNYKIDTKNLLWDLKAHGETLNNIGLGMSKAVEERLKSERFKTELITNVSHDIKTPLTSIVNYVDLLKKENIENEKASEYIEVLVRQSARLKKLTEDLVEASKALSGTIVVNPVRTNAVELLNQSLGEYAERFEASHLDVIVHAPQEKADLFADGKLLWRVFDNLLNNICKYSQPNTRVYLDVSSAKGKVVITFKNISKYPLNVTADELQERFVRGDSSRSTEGSGLGLSIAKSLIELQKGGFELSIDGDLFKAVISFSAID